MSPVEAGFEEHSLLGDLKPGHYRLTISRTPPVASQRAKQLYRELCSYNVADDVGSMLDIIARYDPTAVMDLRWAWKVNAPLE